MKTNAQFTRRFLRRFESIIGPILSPFEIAWDLHLSHMIDRYPERFVWVDDVPQTRLDRWKAWKTGCSPWEGWRNWIDE